VDQQKKAEQIRTGLNPREYSCENVVDVRLVPAGVRPPVPGVEDDHAGAEPGVAGDGVELKHPADGLLDDVHQVGAPVVRHRQRVVLHPPRTLVGNRFRGRPTVRHTRVNTETEQTQ
jgi:hypothetical protein